MQNLGIVTDTVVINTWTWEKFTETVIATFGSEFEEYCDYSSGQLTKHTSTEEYEADDEDEPLTDEYLRLWLEDCSECERKNVLLYALAERGVIPAGRYEFTDL